MYPAKNDGEGEEKLTSNFTPTARFVEIDGVESWFAEEHVEKRRVERLDHKEEELLSGNIPRGQSTDNAWWISPYPISDEIRVPWAFLMSA